jgi:DNA invertase Pin-like site-specific DNA recombinase
VVDTRSATGRLILAIFEGFAQFEREIMLERQREGSATRRPQGSTLVVASPALR